MVGADVGNEFIVVSGEAAGDRIVIPPGTVTIGSGDSSALRLPVSGVSRRHALLIPVHGRTILADQQSLNGSWVNGQRVDTSIELSHGDLVQFGQLRLRFIDRSDGNEDRNGTADGNRGGDENRGGSGGEHRGGSGGEHRGGSGNGDDSSSGKKGQQQARERLGTALTYAAGINGVGLAGNSLASFLTELTPTWTWFITPVIGLLVALAIETLGYHRKGRGASQGAPQGVSYGAPERRPAGGAPTGAPQTAPVPAYAPKPGRAPRRPLGATVLLTVLLLGAGGWLVSAGASYAVGYFSGNEMGTQRLEHQVVAEAQGVRLAVLGVQSTAHFTRVEILVSNGTRSSISLPLFQNAILTAPDGTTYDADAFRSNWEPQVPAGGQRRGTLNFENQLPEGSTTLSLSFVTVFVQGFDGPRSITVPHIPVEPLDSRAAAVTAGTARVD